MQKSCEARDRSARPYDYPPQPLPNVPTKNLPQLRREQKLSFQLRLVTPAFLGGAEARVVDPYTPLRVPSVRGQLRMWFRAAVASCLGVAPGPSADLKKRQAAMITELKRIETSVFGSTTTPSQVSLGPVTGGPRPVQYPSPDPKKSPGLRYLGYGLFESTGATCLPQGSSYSLCVHVKEEALVPLVAATVWLWTALGGLGARSRRGWGSLTLTKVEGPPGIASWQKLCRPVESPEGLSNLQGKGIAAVQDAIIAYLRRDDRRVPDEMLADGCVGHAQIRSLDAMARVMLPEVDEEPLQVLERVGERFRSFRSSLARSKPLPDYALVKASLGHGAPPASEVPRAAFGLPLNFFFRSANDAKTSFTPEFEGQALDRLASPLIFRVHPVQAGARTKYAVMLAHFTNERAPLLGASLRQQGKQGAIPAPTDALIREFFEHAQQAGGRAR